MRLLSNDDLRPHLGLTAVMAAYETVLREYYAGRAVARPRIDVWSPTSRPDHFYQWGTMEGLSRQFGVFVTRMKSDIAYFETKADGTRTQEKFNTRPGLYCGLMWVFSIETGTPLAILQDGYVQHLRVAAKAGLAAREAALPGPVVIALLGSGGMARSHLQAFAAVRPIRAVRVYSPTRANRERFATEMSTALGLDVQAVDRAETAVRGAQVVACCTSAIEPILRGDWLADGAFVSTVKGHAELDDTAWSRTAHVIDFGKGDAQDVRAKALPQEGVGSLSGKFQAYAAGPPGDFGLLPRGRNSAKELQRPRVFFQDILAGRAAGRTDACQIIGMGGGESLQGLQFAAVAGLVCQLAEERDLGRILPDEWFLQSERN